MYQIMHFINCNTTRVPCIIECPCHKYYMDKTKRTLKVKIGKHLARISGKDDETPIDQHFAQFHNGQPKGLKIKGSFALK